MPQIIIHSSYIPDNEKKQLLLDKVRVAVSGILDIPSNIGQVILYETAPENRSNHSSRDQNFIFVEAIMYPGRSKELKQKFADEIIGMISQYTGINTKDINLVIYEINKENYFGGISHDK